MGLDSRRDPVILTGPEYLAQATRLLQRMRLARPTGGIWEAADLHWWRRQERDTDAAGQLFWLDKNGAPLAAVVLTEFHGTVQCDVLVLPDDPAFATKVWEAALDRAAALAPTAEFPVRADDGPGGAALAAAGAVVSDEAGVVASWLAAQDRPEVASLPPGYRLTSWADTDDTASVCRPSTAGVCQPRPHPMASRNGAEVGTRLRTCSLYDPELDLAVVAPDGSVAGYGLFWADPITKVGLVEPMRTEPGHEGRGIASQVLAVGLDLLADRGCRRLKVSNDLSLYLRAGFVPLATATASVYRVTADRAVPGPESRLPAPKITT